MANSADVTGSAPTDPTAPLAVAESETRGDDDGASPNCSCGGTSAMSRTAPAMPGSPSRSAASDRERGSEGSTPTIVSA